jgi:hypothetical protein
MLLLHPQQKFARCHSGCCSHSRWYTCPCRFFPIGRCFTIGRFFTGRFFGCSSASGEQAEIASNKTNNKLTFFFIDFPPFVIFLSLSSDTSILTADAVNIRYLFQSISIIRPFLNDSSAASAVTVVLVPSETLTSGFMPVKIQFAKV